MAKKVNQEANLENDLKVLIELEKKSGEQLTLFQIMETLIRTKSNKETPGAKG